MLRARPTVARVRWTITRLLVLAIFAGALALGIGTPADASRAQSTDGAAAATKESGHLYDRLVIIGASASDGFGVAVFEEVAANAQPAESTPAATKKGRRVSLNLSDVLRLAMTTNESTASDSPKRIVHHYASGFFFSNPGVVGRGEVDRALNAKPTLVLGLDFLFWYVYGTVSAEGTKMQTSEERLANLDAGLAQLDRVVAAGVPLVISDVPDMHAAIGKMLAKNQVPAVETIASANTRIAEWIATRPTARLIRLSQILGLLKAGGTVDLAGRTWTTDEFGDFLQRDQLHPTFVGTVIIAAALIDLARGNEPTLDPPYEFTPATIRARAIAQDAKKPQKPAPVTGDSKASQ